MVSMLSLIQFFIHMFLHLHSNLFPEILNFFKKFSLSKFLGMNLSSLFEMSKFTTFEFVLKYSTTSSEMYLILLLLRSSLDMSWRNCRSTIPREEILFPGKISQSVSIGSDLGIWVRPACAQSTTSALSRGSA